MLDLHVFSEGAAETAVRWWLDERLPAMSSTEQLIIVTGWGKSRAAYQKGDVRGRVIKVLHQMGVSMLPTLVIVDGTTGKVLTDWGRAAVMRNPKGCVAAWKAGGHGCSWVQLVTGGGSCILQ